MQFSDIPEQEKREAALVVSLNATDQGKRLIELFRRELSRMDKQNRVIGHENKESAAQWLGEFLEQVDSRTSTVEEMPPDEWAPTAGK